MAPQPADELPPFRALVEHSFDAVALLDAQGRFRYVSPSTTRVLGYRPDELLGRDALELVHPDDLERMRAVLAGLLEQPGVSLSAEYRYLHQDGSWRWLEGVGTNLLAEPSVGAVVANVRDVTERHLAADEVARLAAIVESSDDAIIAETLDGILTSWNTGAERLYGYAAAEAVGRPRSIIVPPERSGEFPEMLSRLRSGERIHHFETVRLRKDGQRIHVSVSMSPIRDASGQVVGSAGIGRDIGARKRREEAERFLDEAGRMLASTLDYETVLASLIRLPVPRLADYCSIYTLDDQRVLRPIQVAHVYPAKEGLIRELERIHPLQAGEGSTLGRILESGELQFTPEVTDTILEAYARDEHELAILRALAPRSVIILPLIAHGRALGVLSLVMAVESERRYTPDDVVLARELAQRAALAVDNARLYKEAREAVRVRDEFFSVASHELRNPLAVLTAHTQLMLRALDRAGSLDPERARRSLGDVEQQAVRLRRLIERLLDTTRLESGKLPIEPEPLDLRQIVDQAVSAAQATTDRHQLRVFGPGQLSATLDPVRIEQVLANLLDNAVKHSPDGGPIEVELAASGDSVCLTVRDHGPGISEDRRGRIFERFYQAHDSQGGGLGLGLYISRRLVELHGGRLTADFPADGGARFAISLPTAVLDDTRRDLAAPGSPS